jgi:hypothetical protein
MISHSKILHARLSVGETVLMGSDAPADRYEAMRGFSVMLGVADPAAAECVFQALAENGTVRMAIQKTFWAARFGMLVDQYGTPWMIQLRASRMTLVSWRDCGAQRAAERSRACVSPPRGARCGDLLLSFRRSRRRALSPLTRAMTPFLNGT